MLTQIRHIQKGTLIVVTIIIVIAFAFLYSDFDFGGGGRLGTQNCVLKVYDRCLRAKEVQKLASYYDVARDLGMGEFTVSMFGESRVDDDRANFVRSLTILRKEAQELGIEPSAGEIKAAIPTLPIFQQPWVNAAFVENNILGPNGFTDGDLAQLVKDYLTFLRVRDLIGAGLATVPSETNKLYTRAFQNYTASLINFDREKAAAGIEITEDEIRTFYDENSENLKSDVHRGYDYAKFSPNTLPEDATLEEQAKAEQAFLNAINYAYADLADPVDGEKSFNEIAKNYAGEKPDYVMIADTYEPFKMSEAPDDIAENTTLLNQLFSEALTVGSVTVPISTEAGSYYVFALTSQQDPEPLSRKEARPLIVQALTAKNSNRAVNDAASAARAAINEALESGKSFVEAAEAAKVEVEALPVFSINEMPESLENSSSIAVAVGEMGENKLSEVIQAPGGEGFMLVYVDKIELYENEEEESTKRAIASSMETGLRYRMFNSWFNQRKKESSYSRSGSSGLVNE